MLLEKYFRGIGAGVARVAPCSFSDYSMAQYAPVKDIDLLMMARFVPGKGYDLLEQIQWDILGCNVHCYGSGPLRIDIKNAYIGYADNPYQIYSRTKIFLSLQKEENYPSQAALEAMASGCAIIATDVGETRRFLDETCAVLIDYSADSLKAAVIKLLCDDYLRSCLGSRARERVLREHTIEFYAKYFREEILGINCSHHHKS